ATAVNTISFNYNPGGQLLSEGDANSAYQFTYDTLSRLATTSNSGTPGVPTVVLINGYDPAGERTSLSATINGVADFTNTYQIDPFGKATRIEQFGTAGGNAVANKRVDLAFNSLGELTAANRYSDLGGTQLVMASNYGYDVLGRLTSLNHVHGATTLAGYTFT